MHYLVTGGAGFIGSHFCERLLAEQHKVTCVDDLSTGRLANLSSCLNNPNFEFVEHDIRSQFHFSSADVILHLACAASPVHYQADPIKTLETNFLGTKHLLELANKMGAKLLFTSTSEVYGDPKVHPQDESYWGHVNCFGPRSCYDEGKRVAESLCREFSITKNVPVRIARIFNTYGPNMAINDGRIISNFITQAIQGDPITIYGEGKQTRSFCYVSDTVDGLLRLSASDVETPVNIGAPFEFTVLALATKIKEVLNSSSELVFMPLPGDDPTQRKPDITKAKTLLDWAPTVDLDTGLNHTIKYFYHALTQTTPA